MWQRLHFGQEQHIEHIIKTYHMSSSSFSVGAESVSGMLAWTSSNGIDCSIAGDECIYTWYALLLHSPKILMSHSDIPAAAAVVLVPPLKLWLEYCWWLNCVFCSNCRIDVVKCLLPVKWRKFTALKHQSIVVKWCDCLSIQPKGSNRTGGCASSMDSDYMSTTEWTVRLIWCIYH